MKFPLLFLLTGMLTATPMNAQFSPAPQAPRPDKKPRDVSIHGDPRTDDYFWLREKENPAVIQHLKAENAHTDAVLAPAAALREKLYTEMVGRMKEDDSSVPNRLHGWFWYERSEKGKQHPILCRQKDTPGAAEEIVVDVNRLAEGKEYAMMEDYRISPDGTRLVYLMDWTGYREYEPFVLNLKNLETVAQKIGKVSSLTWAGDENTLYFTTENEAKRSDKFWRFDLGTGKRELLFEEKDELFDVAASCSADHAFVFCTSGSKTTTEVRAIPGKDPGAKPRILLPRVTDHEYHAEHRGDRFYFVTNRDAKNFRIVSAPETDPSAWSDVLPHQPAVKVDGVVMFQSFMAVTERESGLPQIRLYDFASATGKRLTLPEAAYDIMPDENPDFSATEFRLRYESMVTPPSIRSVGADAGDLKILKNKEVPGYDASKYRTERIEATAADGTKIPISLVYRADLDRTKPQPLHLYAYGSYGISETASFSSTRVSLLDRGMVFAIAHIRGGGEMGEEWRDAGRMEHKMTTFTDFVSCAEFFVRTGWTTPSRMVISGGSAGGMLMGAVLNLRPDLFQAAILDVPFVDVLNTMLDDSLPLTTSEYVEWGNPNIKEQYAWMRAYSPYDNLKAAAFPHVLVNVGLNDSQVPYWEGAKYAAKLRGLRTDNKVTLLHCDMGAGHGGVAGRYDALKETARDMAFQLSALGIQQ
ncbi:MAG: oligopeptidase [Verrucomicrobiales bacterium]|nr:oligopeptidase [Verrucomicrobiales bacterium]